MDKMTKESIDAATNKSIDALTEESIDDVPTLSIDTDWPEKRTFLLTNFNIGKVVLGDPKGRVCNTSNQFNYRHRDEIPVGIAVVLNAGLEHHPTLGDFNRPDWLYTNRYVIRPPTIQRKAFELKPKYFFIVG